MHYPTTNTLNRTLLVTAISTVFVAVSTFSLPHDLARIATVAGLFILLAGLLRLAQLQGQRTALLRRFVSPNVRAVLDRRGLQAIQDNTESEISVACADIRNFTRFSSTMASPLVVQFLRDYYDAVGAVVTRHGGTIKDYAGDGILVLVGAPLPVTDHADRAVKMALAIREAALEVTERWSHTGTPLGIGVGVASGVTTVGLVGGSERLEYAAVGPAVNLASRLCGEAARSEILVDDRTCKLACVQRAAVPAIACRTLKLKGFDKPVAGFAL